MSIKLTHIVFLLLIITSLSCKKDAVPETDYPFVILTEINDINKDGAAFHGNISNYGNQEIVDYGFIWEESPTKPTLNNIIKSFGHKTKAGKFSCRVNYDLEKDITYCVRAYVKTDKIVVYSNILLFKSKGCLPPVITMFYPDSGSCLITIIGKNFSSKLANNKINIGTVQANAVKYSIDTLFIQCPYNIETYSGNIRIEVAKQYTESNLKFTFIDPWLDIGYFPGGPRYGSFSFVIDYKGYSGSGMNLDYFAPLELWEFNSILKEWKTKSFFPGPPRYDASAFELNGKGYVCFGNDPDYNDLKDIWEYNPINDQWQQKTDFPGNLWVSQSVLIMNNKAYFINKSCELWCYNPISDAWSLIKESLGFSKLKVAHEYNGFGYLLSGDGKIWKYNPINNDVQLYFELPVTSMSGAALIKGFYLKNIFYFATKPYWIGFDIQTGSTFFFNNWPFNSSYMINNLFCFEEKVYMTSGEEDTGFWEFYPR
jgi:IPT/TIG domain